MVSRRGVLGGATAMATALLGGCGFGSRRLVGATEEAAAAVDGVSEAEFELDIGGTFARLLYGPVSLEAEDRATGLAVFDEAMRAVVTTIHDTLDDSAARSVRVGGITGVLAGGEELSALDLGPETTAENPRLDRITAESFYLKYGLS
ncbi:MAG: hypothetical protein L0H74_15190 [Brachybacterium sp.]|nr:hypothetical protein [Brachybacterium sp.]